MKEKYYREVFVINKAKQRKDILQDEYLDKIILICRL